MPTGQAGTFSGSYTRIGNRCMGSAIVRLTAKGTVATGNLLMGALPFASVETEGTPCSVVIVQGATGGHIDRPYTAEVTAGAATINFRRVATAGDAFGTVMTDASVTNTFEVHVSFNYRVA